MPLDPPIIPSPAIFLTALSTAILERPVGKATLNVAEVFCGNAEAP